MQDIDSLLSKVHKIHFIGIGGAGMCPLAEILHSKGYLLSGSDNNESDNVDRMRALGIPVSIGHSKENIGDAEMIVHTAALLPGNPEMEAAKEKGIPIFERSKLFGWITRKYDNCIGVCGTHGKTTVTSMLTQIMIMAGTQPSAVIGGKLPLINSNGIVGTSDTLVCEACEFVDTFLELSPDVSVILNIDEDHLDYFKTVDNLISSFTKFADMSKTVIYNGDDANTLKAVSSLKDKKKITFGIDFKNDFYAENITMNRGAFPQFDIIHHGKNIGNIKLAVPGDHNISNALAAIAAAMDSGVSIEKCIEGLEAFRGAGRRFEILGEYCGITIVDDYAHHPAELAVTLTAAKKMEYNRVWAVFQPFTFSRTAMLMDDFAKALSIADYTVLTEIMGSREVNTYNIYASQLADKIPNSVWYNTFDEVAQHVVDHAKAGDLVITLGCGDVYKAAKMMIKKYKDK